MLNKKVVLIAALASMSFGDLFAGTLSSYSIGDVLLCFRKSGGTSDLVVDLGPVSTLTNAAPNSRTVITKYAGNQLAVIGTNNLIWSAFTYFDGTVSPSSIQNTLFASNPRSSLNTQTQPPYEFKSSSQQQVVNYMKTVPVGADYYLNSNILNSATAVLEPDSVSSPNYQVVGGTSYANAIDGGVSGGDENFGDTYSSYPENTTPANFTTASTVERSDFYWMPPAPTPQPNTYPGTFLGYFELNTNGVMTYVAYPASAPTTPVIESITRANHITSVTFTTGSTGTYTLRGTNIWANAGSLTNWPAITSTLGNGSPNTLQDTTTATNKFYVITAQ